MIDSSIYTNTSGSKNILHSMQMIAHNLANINTTGFHADYENITTKNESGSELKTRMFSERNSIYTDSHTGPINYTGRELDVAIDGPGFISVQTKSGKVGYTRAGSLNITPQGLLVTDKGDIVLGTAGVINVPASAKVSIDKKGIISAHEAGQPANTLAEIGQIKLVEAAPDTVAKGEDGIYYPIDGSNPTESMNVRLVPESLEGSNVDAIRALTDLIELSRQFDMNSKQISSVEQNADKANQLLNIQA